MRILLPTLFALLLVPHPGLSDIVSFTVTGTINIGTLENGSDPPIDLAGRDFVQTGNITNFTDQTSSDMHGGFLPASSTFDFGSDDIFTADPNSYLYGQRAFDGADNDQFLPIMDLDVTTGFRGPGDPPFDYIDVNVLQTFEPTNIASTNNFPTFVLTNSTSQTLTLEDVSLSTIEVVSKIPEPSTTWLIVGLFGAVQLRRRRRS